MATYATVNDIQDRWEQPIPTEAYARVDVLISRAERTLRATVGDQAQRIVDQVTTVEDVRDVVCEMVLRVLRNPSGNRSQTTGPWSYTVDPSVSSARLFVSQSDRRQLGLRSAAVSVPVNDPALAALFLNPHHDEWPAGQILPTP